MKAKRARKTDAPAVLDRAPTDLVRLPEILRRTGLSRPTIYRRMAVGQFPQRVPLGGNSVAWYEGQIAEWLANPAGWQSAAA